MIIGNRIKLVGFSERDILPNIQDWLGRDQIRWLYAEYPVFHHIEREHFSRFAMAIHTMNEDQPIGWVDLRAYDEFNRSGIYEIVIADPSYYSTGHALDATTVYLDYLYGNIGLNRVQAQVFEFNSRARIANERFGFRLEGVSRSSLYRFGKFWDTHQYGLLASEFYQLPTAMYLLSKIPHRNPLEGSKDFG